MWRSSSNESCSGRSHQSCTRWPKTTPIRRASWMRCRDGSRPATAIRPALGTRMPGQHLHGRRLAGAVRADVADELAGLDPEADPVDRAHLAPLAADPAALDAEREGLLDAVELDHAPTLR